ncbi:MAG: hypothetical protein AAF744_12160 [Pseudomonadota bacterium]
MPRRSVSRVVETLEFEFFDARFRSWATAHAGQIRAALEPRLAHLTSQQLVQAGRLMLATGATREGTAILSTALDRARDETDLRIALSALSMLPLTTGLADDMDVEVDIDRRAALQMLMPYAAHFNGHIRRLARQGLQRLELPEISGLQRQWLGGEDDAARLDAALSLGLRGDPAAWPVLKAKLEGPRGQGGYWQAAVMAATKICRDADASLRAEIAETGRALVRARLHLNDNATANEVLNLRPMISAGGQPWHFAFLEEQLAAGTCFAEYVVGEWAWRTGPAAIPRLIAYLDDPVLSRGVIDYLGKTSNPKLGTAEDQAPLRARLEAFLAQEAARKGPFADTWRSEIARALKKLGSIENVDPDAVLDHTAYETRLQQLGLAGDALWQRLRTAFPTLKTSTEADPFNALLSALFDSALIVIMRSEPADFDSFVDGVDEVLALAAPVTRLQISGWPEEPGGSAFDLALMVDGAPQRLRLSADCIRVPEMILQALNAAIAQTGYAYAIIDLDMGGDGFGVTFGKSEALRQLAKEIRFPAHLP